MDNRIPLPGPCVPELGRWITACGPTEPSPRSHPAIGLACIALALALAVYPSLQPPKAPDQVAGIRLVFSSLAMLAGLAGLVFVFAPWVNRPREVHLFEKGLVAKQGKADRVIPWSKIKSATLYEWYEAGWESPSLNAVLELHDERRPVKFNSQFPGDSSRIIEALQVNFPETRVVAFDTE